MGDCALISHMFWSVYVPPRWYFQCVAVCKCMFVWKHASGLLLQGVRRGGTSCIIDVSPRFAHVAPPGDGVPGGEVPEQGEARRGSKPAPEALNISADHFHLYNGNYPSH